MTDGQATAYCEREREFTFANDQKSGKTTSIVKGFLTGIMYTLINFLSYLVIL